MSTCRLCCHTATQDPLSILLSPYNQFQNVMPTENIVQCCSTQCDMSFVCVKSITPLEIVVCVMAEKMQIWCSGIENGRIDDDRHQHG